MARRSSTQRTVTTRKSDGAVVKKLTVNIPAELAKRLAHAAIDEERGAARRRRA